MNKSIINIKSIISNIYDNSQSIGSSSDELSATIEEINSTTTELAIRATDSNASTHEIRKRAIEIKDKGMKAIEISRNIYTEKSNNIIKAIEEGKVVEQVKIMTESIDQVSSSIQNVSAIIEESACSTEEIQNSINETTLSTVEVAKSSQIQSELAEKLINMVHKFKI